MKNERQENDIKSNKGQVIQVINQSPPCHQQLGWALVHWAKAPNDSPHQTKDTKPSMATAWQIVCIHVTDSDQTNRSKKYHGGLRIPKIERKCQQSRKKNSQTLRPDVRATNKRGSIIWSQEGPVFCMWKYQITITFTRILEAWVALFEQKQHIMVWGIDAVCLFCGQFAELMGFTVQNEREWNGAIWCLSRLCGRVGDSAQSKRATMWRVKVNNHDGFH